MNDPDDEPAGAGEVDDEAVSNTGEVDDEAVSNTGEVDDEAASNADDASAETAATAEAEDDDTPAFGVERYLNVRSAHGATFSPDGDRLTFLMDATGTPQVWSLGAPREWPSQHTFYDERVTFADWSPERFELAFGRDEGGNERQQLFRLSPATGAIRNLTERPDAKHYWGGWSHDGDRFAFTSNRRDEAVFDVYVQDRDAVPEGDDDDVAELVREGEAGWLSVVGWSPSDDRLLVHESRSSFDQDLHVLDLATGEMTHVTPHEGEVRYRAPAWASEGDAVYACTDREADTLELVRLDLDSLSWSVVEDGGEWNVDGVSIDEDTGRVAYSRNVEGYTELTVGEFAAPDRIDAVAEPDLPRGVAGGVSWGPDADRLAVTASGSTDNTNVHVIDVEAGETERWTDAATAGIPRETFVEPELVRYPTFDDREIPAFFSLPDAATDSGGGDADASASASVSTSADADADAGEGDATAPEGSVPVVVDIHGGPESQRRPSFSPFKQFLLAHGYGVFEPNVRGSSGYGKRYSHLDDVENRMDSVTDVRAAVEWLHEHPEVDPDRIVAMGGSYGGFMVLASLTEYPDLWAAGVDIVGIANFVTFLENTGDWRRELREAEYGSLDEDREFLESVSPINNVENVEAPLFVVHGENDPRVPVGEAHQIVEEARERGVPVRELIFPDEGHGLSKLENEIEAYAEVVEFLDEHVGPGSEA